MFGITACCTGRLGGDADMRFTRAGKPFVSFSLAVDQRKGDDGTEPETQWLKVTQFDVAEDLNARLVKGASVYVEGRLKLSRWEAPDGSPRSGLELVAWTVQPMGQIGHRVPSEARKNAGVAAAARMAAEDMDSIPF
jgi:single-strand DNA-binding protein